LEKNTNIGFPPSFMVFVRCVILVSGFVVYRTLGYVLGVLGVLGYHVLWGDISFVFWLALTPC